MVEKFRRWDLKTFPTVVCKMPDVGRTHDIIHGTKRKEDDNDYLAVVGIGSNPPSPSQCFLGL
jgi:hypothetical protein